MSRTLLLLLCVVCSGTGKKGASEPGPNDKWAIPASLQEDEKKPLKYYVTDDEDGALDIDNFLDLNLGFLPIVVPITEPAVGFGLAGGLVFFHDKGEQKPGVPPTVTAVVGGATENGTWMAGVVHQHIWKIGDLRYMGGLGLRQHQPGLLRARRGAR